MLRGVAKRPTFTSSSAQENFGEYLVHSRRGNEFISCMRNLTQATTTIPKAWRCCSATSTRTPTTWGRGRSRRGRRGRANSLRGVTTGTHGGDFRFPPLADSVVALHLVTDGRPALLDRTQGPQPRGRSRTTPSSDAVRTRQIRRQEAKNGDRQEFRNHPRRKRIQRSPDRGLALRDRYRW